VLSGCARKDAPVQPVQPGGQEEPVSQQEPLEVYFLDVGNADCAIIRYGQYAMIIDAADYQNAGVILGTLSALGIARADYLITSHPHADHIGSVKQIVENIEVGYAIICPDVDVDTASFEIMMEALYENEIETVTASTNLKLEFGDCDVTVYAPLTDYENLNNDSLVVKLVHGDNSFLFTGDIEYEAERDLRERYDLSASVLKVPHHGSYTSTSYGFLYLVNPAYAVISCGAGNKYGHPDESVLSRLHDADVTVYRTDLNGTVEFVSDKTSLQVYTDR